MKKQHPVTYEHIGLFFKWLVIIAVSLFIAYSAVSRWVDGSATELNTIRTVACYDQDGTGPLYECRGVQIKCYNKANTNGDAYKIDCPPMF